MYRKLRKFFTRRIRNREVDPDEILLDSSNLPQFDTHQFEGRLEQPISKTSLVILGIFFLVVGGVYVSKVGQLQIVHGEEYAQKSENNRLKHTLLFADRGVVYDRNKVELAWNVARDDKSYSLREYKNINGLGHVLGYIKYPSKDSHGFYYREDYIGMDGVEKVYNDVLKGENGLRIVETDALGKVLSESVIKPPKPGTSVTLSIDARLQEKFYEYISSLAKSAGYSGGAALLMDIHTGELVSMVSYPEYNPKALSDGSDSSLIKSYLTSPQLPFLNRVTLGSYTPGSIIKIFMALAALNEGVIDPSKQILSTGSISVPNPYDPKLKTVFNDWKAHGLVDMRRALAVSSNVYFYAIGGGFDNQKGLGIANIEKYVRMFGFGSPVKDSFFDGASGIIPNPEWKKKNFKGDDWRVGDTYYTAIGQYGFQVTPIQVIRAVASVANGGTLLTPSILKNEGELPQAEQVPIPAEYFKIVREGMRQGAVEGTGSGLNLPYVKVATKTGTAELGVLKNSVNSWAVGFFPYDRPRYAFAIAMEKGPRENTLGGIYIMRQMFEWMHLNTPEYLE